MQLKNINDLFNRRVCGHRPRLLRKKNTRIMSSKKWLRELDQWALNWFLQLTPRKKFLKRDYFFVQTINPLIKNPDFFKKL